jgi:hypothetical protein
VTARLSSARISPELSDVGCGRRRGRSFAERWTIWAATTYRRDYFSEPLDFFSILVYSGLNLIVVFGFG